jgi:peptidoglycan/xylan/chitin deacetylase (PgdA/CDA1 family)
MKLSVRRRRLWGTLVLFLAFSGCASRKAAFGGPPPAAAERGKPRPLPPPETPALDRVLERIKHNGPEIKKYLPPGESDPSDNGAGDGTNAGYNIILKADIPGYEVSYDLLNARPLDALRWAVDFRVEEIESGLAREETLIWEPREDGAGILLAFDDYYPEAWEAHFDLLARYDARVTFFIQGEVCAFCLRAWERGHDIGYHSLNHRDLRRLSREEFLAETLFPAESFRRSGISLSSFAFPYGFFEPWMREILAPEFAVLRGYGVRFRVYDEEIIREGLISSQAVDNILYQENRDFEKRLGLILRVVKFLGPGTIVSFTTHDISDTAAWGIKPARLEFLLRSARDLKLRFYLYRDFAPR